MVQELSKGTAHVATFTAKEAAAVNTAVEIPRPHDIALTEAARQVPPRMRFWSGSAPSRKRPVCSWQSASGSKFLASYLARSCRNF